MFIRKQVPKASQQMLSARWLGRSWAEPEPLKVELTALVQLLLLFVADSMR